MSFLRHIGKHGDRKVAVIFREVPNEDHMCLVTYTELLNRHIHDPMMKCIESDIGQSSETLADALNRSFTTDGKSILQVLHFEGQLKKVQTELIVMTPAPNVKIKLNELNKMLNEMKQGEEAVKRLTEIDNSRGLQDPADVARRMRNNQAPTPVPEAATAAATTASTMGELPPTKVFAPNDMSDAAIAYRMRVQAHKMSTEGRGLLAEAERLTKEAQTLDPALPVEQKPATIVQETSVKQPVVAARRPGRPKKSTATVA